MGFDAEVTLEVDGHPTEYGQPRNFEMFLRRPANPDENTGILLVAHDRGQEAGHSYYRGLRADWAERFNMVTVGLDFLGTRACLEPSCRVDIPRYLMNDLESTYPGAGDDIPGLFERLKGSNLLNLRPGFLLVNERLAGGDYWDFGLIQAVDVIYACRVTLEFCRQNGITINNGRIMVYGIGEGGHIAQMCGRLAPSTFSAVADLGSKAFVSPRSMLPAETGSFKRGTIPGYDITAWVAYPEIYSLEQDSPYPVTRDMVQVRNLTRFLPPAGCRYLMFTVEKDKKADVAGRKLLVNMAGEQGLDISHFLLGDEDCPDNQVDIKLLFEKYCGQTVLAPADDHHPTDFELGTKITLATSNGSYVMDYSGFVPVLRFEGRMERLNRDDIP